MDILTGEFFPTKYILQYYTMTVSKDVERQKQRADYKLLADFQLLGAGIPNL